jgi:hypothetical protein
VSERKQARQEGLILSRKLAMRLPQAEIASRQLPSQDPSTLSCLLHSSLMPHCMHSALSVKLIGVSPCRACKVLAACTCGALHCPFACAMARLRAESSPANFASASSVGVSVPCALCLAVKRRGLVLGRSRLRLRPLAARKHTCSARMNTRAVQQHTLRGEALTCGQQH